MRMRLYFWNCRNFDVVTESISARTLADMDRAVSNFKKGDVSPVIDLSDF